MKGLVLQSYRRHFVAFSLVGLVAMAACTSKEVDPRCRISAPSAAHRGQLAQHINGSELWQAYLDYLSPVREGSKPVVSIDLDFERVITHKTNNGDYDPGIVHADLELRNLKEGTTFLTDYDKFAIKDFVIGDFDRNATREQIQETAFAATEEGAMRFVIYSLDLGVIRAMSDEGRKGRGFIPALQEKREDPWSGDLGGEAKIALRNIQGD